MKVFLLCCLIFLFSRDASAQEACTAGAQAVLNDLVRLEMEKANLAGQLYVANQELAALKSKAAEAAKSKVTIPSTSLP